LPTCNGCRYATSYQLLIAVLNYSNIKNNDPAITRPIPDFQIRIRILLAALFAVGLRVDTELDVKLVATTDGIVRGGGQDE
jgi:hypothetical protein